MAEETISAEWMIIVRARDADDSLSATQKYSSLISRRRHSSKSRNVPLHFGILLDLAMSSVDVERRRGEQPSRGGLTYGNRKVGGHPPLDHVAQHAERLRRAYVVQVFVKCQQHDRRACFVLLQSPGNLESAQAGHRDIEHQDIRIQACGVSQRLFAVFGFADDLAVLTFEKRG